jgi:hypothetical protein
MQNKKRKRLMPQKVNNMKKETSSFKRDMEQQLIIKLRFHIRL